MSVPNAELRLSFERVGRGRMTPPPMLMIQYLRCEPPPVSSFCSFEFRFGIQFEIRFVIQFVIRWFVIRRKDFELAFSCFFSFLSFLSFRSFLSFLYSLSFLLFLSGVHQRTITQWRVMVGVVIRLIRTTRRR